MKLNKDAFDHAKSLIEANHYVKDSDWSVAQPDADTENAKINRDGYDGFGLWHLAVDPAASGDTKARYGFPYGDFDRLHRSAVVAIKQRAGEWDHDDILKAADDLLDRMPDPE